MAMHYRVDSQLAIDGDEALWTVEKESGDPWRRMIRKILDKDRRERYRRAVWDTDSEDTDSEDTIELLEGEQMMAVKKTVSLKSSTV